MPSARVKRLRAKDRYASKKDEVRETRKDYYTTKVEQCKEASRQAYDENPERKKHMYRKAYTNDPKKFKEASKKAYAGHPEKFKEASKKAYANDPDKFKEASKKAYADHPQKFKETSKKAYKKNMHKHKQGFRNNYLEHKEQICSKKREEYVLRPPNEGQVKSYVEGLLRALMCNAEIKLCLTLKLRKLFPVYTEKFSNKMKAKTACRLAAQKIVHDILNLRNNNAGMFLKYVREINSLAIDNVKDFGDCSHSAHSEPFYYETAYLHGFQPTKLVIDKRKRCLSTVEISSNSDQFICSKPIPLDEQARSKLLFTGTANNKSEYTLCSFVHVLIYVCTYYSIQGVEL